MNTKEKNNLSSNHNSRLGTGSIPRLIFSLAVPAMVAQLINVLYNIVDRI